MLKNQRVSKYYEKNVGKKAAGSKLGKMMINDATNYILTAYKKIKNKITNKKVKAMINTGVDDYLVNRGVELIGGRFSQKVYLKLRLKNYFKK